MNTYAPPFKLTNTMLDLVASISEKVGRITTGKNLESKPHLRKNNTEISKNQHLTKDRRKGYKKC